MNSKANVVKNITFSIRAPRGKKKKRFGITKNLVFWDPSDLKVPFKRDQKAVNDPRLDSINTRVHRGLEVAAALAEVKALIPKLRTEALEQCKLVNQATINANNLRLFDEFWKENYAHSKALLPRSKDSARNLLLAALRDIDPFSLTSSTKSELQQKLESLPISRQRRHCIGLNQLLKFAKRDFTLEKHRPESREIFYVTLEELHPILGEIEIPEVKSLALALFGSGVRVGEAFAPGFVRLKPDNTIFIQRQMDVKLEVRDIKNAKFHHTYLLPECKEAYLHWSSLSKETKEKYRHIALKEVSKASKRAYKSKPEKQISCHDLRHSYAIHMLGKGASLSQVANLLGDSLSTVEYHYAGFVLTAEMVSGIAKLFKAS